MAKQTFTTGQVLTAAQMTSLQQTAMLGGAASAKTASYTLVAADAGTAISMSNASATTITVNTALFAAGDTVQITNIGVGVCTITAGTATVNTSASLALAQYESGTLDFTSTSAAIFIKGAGAAAGSGGMTQLATGSLTGASIIISSISGDYRDLSLRVFNYIPASTGGLNIRFNGDSGAKYTSIYYSSSGENTSYGSNQCRLSEDASSTATTGYINSTIFEYANAISRKLLTTLSITEETATPVFNLIGFNGSFNSTAAITSITLLPNTGSFTSGTYFLYGVK